MYFTQTDGRTLLSASLGSTLHREREIMEAVNSYDYDLVRGNLGDGALGQAGR